MYGVDQKEKLENLEKAKVISFNLLSEMTDALNRIHGTTHCMRYWNILLGHWLWRCVSIVLDRHQTLVSTLQETNISGTTTLNFVDTKLDTVVMYRSSNFSELVDLKKWR